MSDAIRSIVNKVRSDGGSLLDFREQLDPDGCFDIGGRSGTPKEVLEEEFMEYLSMTYGIEPEGF